jgi:hypothetical protein
MAEDIPAAEKGERYARIFRKAGAFIGKANLARALEVLKEGRQLAENFGDAKMAQRFADEIERLKAGAGEPSQ